MLFILECFFQCCQFGVKIINSFHLCLVMELIVSIWEIHIFNFRFFALPLGFYFFELYVHNFLFESPSKTPFFNYTHSHIM
jgi:hypothetical protein